MSVINQNGIDVNWLQTITSAALGSGAVYFSESSLKYASVLSDIEDILATSPKYTEEAIYAALAQNGVSTNVMSSAMLSSALRGTALTAALVYAVSEIWESSDPLAETFKQVTLAAVGYVVVEAVVAALTLAGVAAIAGGPTAVMAVGLLAAGAIVAVYDAEWDNLIAAVDSLATLGVAKADAMVQIASDFISFSAWLDDSGISAIEFIRNPEAPKRSNFILKSIERAVFGAFPTGGIALEISAFARMIANLSSPTLTDPIVLDLGGGGIELVSVENSNAHFDLHDTGFAVKTGWVGPNTGILVLPNLDGSVTDIKNLFGNNSVDGFTAMQAIDSNGDGILDANDVLFNNLRVWVDSNGDGNDDVGELKTLSDLDIISISLNPTPTNQIVNGNVIAAIAHYTKSDNSTGQVAEAFFNNNQIASSFNGSFELNPQVLALPNQRGYGLLPDLYIAMSLDTVLLEMVQNLMNSNGITDLNQQIEDIIYRWADVGNVSDTGRGDYVNGKHLAVIEKIIGHAWVDRINRSNPGNERDGLSLEKAYNLFFINIRNHLAIQGPLSDVFENVNYNYSKDIFEGNVNFESLIAYFDANSFSTNTFENAQYWIDAITMIDTISGELGISINSYDALLQAVLASAGLPSSLSAIHNLHIVKPFEDSNGNNIFEVSGSSARGAIIQGHPSGNNILIGAYELEDALVNNIQIFKSIYGTLTLSSSQLAGIDAFEALQSNGLIIKLVGEGIYDFGEKSVSGNITFTTESATGAITIIASSSDTLFQDGPAYGWQIPGTDLLHTYIGGSGDDIFHLYQGMMTPIIDGGAGNDQLNINYNGSYYNDISGLSLSNIEILNILSGWLKLSSDQLSMFGAIYTNGGYLGASSGGVYDFRNKILGEALDFRAGTAPLGDVVTVIGSDEANTMSAGDGEFHFIGGIGDDIFNVYNGASGSSIIGGGGNDVVRASGQDISGITISSVDTLSVASESIKLTANQLSSFSNLTSFYGSPIVFYASNLGLYDFTGKGLNSSWILSAALATDIVTIQAGESGSILEDGIYASNLLGNSGDDTFILRKAVEGTVLDGGAGYDTLDVQLTNFYSRDISKVSITNIEKLRLYGGTVIINDTIFNSLESIETNGSSLAAGGGGTYDFSNLSIDYPLTFYSGYTGENVTFIGGNLGNVAYDGSGITNLVGGIGDDTFYVQYGSEGGHISGGGGIDTVVAQTWDISGLTFSDVDIISTGYDLKMTASQLNEFATLHGQGGDITISAAGAGNYDISSKNIQNGYVHLSAAQTIDDVILQAGSFDTQFTDGDGSNTFIGGGGSNTYKFSSLSGRDVILNNALDNIPTGQVVFSSINQSSLWFEQVGDDLNILQLGTNNSLTLSNWFVNDGDKVQYFNAQGAILTNSGVSQLISAMAAFSSSNASFDPTQMAMPNDMSITNAIAVNWS